MFILKIVSLKSFYPLLFVFMGIFKVEKVTLSHQSILNGNRPTEY